MTVLPMAVILVRWKNGEELVRCLQSIFSGGGGRPEEIILVDSGSGDGGARTLIRDFPSVRVLELEENLGFAAAANRGVSLTTAPVLTLLNPDTLVLDGALEKLYVALRESSAAGVVPQLFSPGRESQFRWQLRELPTLGDLLLGRSGRPAFRRQPPDIVEIAQPAAAAWTLRRDIWESLGGLDEGFTPAWWEDVDFCMRLRNAIDVREVPCERGFLLQPDIHILHEGASSLEKLGRLEFLEIFYRNLILYTAKHYPRALRWVRTAVRVKLSLYSKIGR